MGLEYKIVQSDRKELDRVTCDKCGAEIEKTSDGGWNQFGDPYSIYHEPSFGYGNFFLLEQHWGYGSTRDGQTDTAVLCEPCYNAVFQGVKIQVAEHF